MLDTDFGTLLQAQVAGFASPLTRMLLAGNGLTTPVLEAALGTALRVRVLRQDCVSVEQIPDWIVRDLRLVGGDRAVVRRSCLVDSGMTLVSVNFVVAAADAATASGIDRVDIPIGYSLINFGVVQYRRNLRAGLARWPDGRRCAAKAYVVQLDDQPVCYIRECFNPSLIPGDLSDARCRQSVDPAGLHLETSLDDATECIGGCRQLDENDLARNYRTHCDPRLNDIQTIGCVTAALRQFAQRPRAVQAMQDTASTG